MPTIRTWSQTVDCWARWSRVADECVDGVLMASSSEFTVAPSIQLVLGTVVAIAAFIVLFVLLIRLGRARGK